MRAFSHVRSPMSGISGVLHQNGFVSQKRQVDVWLVSCTIEHIFYYTGEGTDVKGNLARYCAKMRSCLEAHAILRKV